MNQTIGDDIVARFGREGWLVQKIKESFWALRPKGTFNYKVFLLVYNPFTRKFQVVKPPTPNDPHYQAAVEILAGDRPFARPSDRKRSTFDLSIIKVPSMFPIKVDNQWINLAAIMTLKILMTDSGLEVDILWENGDNTTFKGKKAATIIAEYEKAADLIMQRLETA